MRVCEVNDFVASLVFKADVRYIYYVHSVGGMCIFFDGCQRAHDEVGAAAGCIRSQPREVVIYL